MKILNIYALTTYFNFSNVTRYRCESKREISITSNEQAHFRDFFYEKNLNRTYEYGVLSTIMKSQKRNEKQRTEYLTKSTSDEKSCLEEHGKKFSSPSLFFRCTISLMVKDIHGLKLMGKDDSSPLTYSRIGL